MITICSSLAGRSHLAAGRVNQDSAGLWRVDCSPPVFGGAAASRPMPGDLRSLFSMPTAVEGVAMAVADGHGSARYDRSHVGSALAVGLALATCGQVLARLNRGGLSTNWCETELPRRLTQQWRRLVLSEHGPDWEHDDPQATSDYIIRHGTTLAGALSGPGGLLLFHIGDGEIVVITKDDVVHRPVLETTELLGAEVESLCQPEADQAFRVALLPWRGDEVKMIMMASDGVTNSFVENDGFEVMARQFLERTVAPAPGGLPLVETVDRAIARSSSYTGDDVSIAAAIDDQRLTGG